MVKIKLDRQYLWSGTFYGPGEVQVPESFVDAYNLKPQKSKQKTDNEGGAKEHGRQGDPGTGSQLHGRQGEAAAALGGNLQENGGGEGTSQGLPSPQNPSEAQNKEE